VLSSIFVRSSRARAVNGTGALDVPAEVIRG
jgi:hypothetical protein